MGLMDSDPGHPSDYDLVMRELGQRISAQRHTQRQEIAIMLADMVNAAMSEVIVAMQQLLLQQIEELREEMRHEMFNAIMQSQAASPPIGVEKLNILQRLNSYPGVSLSALGAGVLHQGKEERKEGIYSVNKEERKEEGRESDDEVKAMLGAILSRLSKLEDSDVTDKGGEASSKEDSQAEGNQPLYRYSWGKYDPMAYQRSVSELGNFK